ncbi:uncharacterized protein HKW66_Vig0248030 [Vigna angularis]|uniref:Uncharacterized protein n=1 Tax=Phaseolus angularis TaxID=3914 RepID=A0A8T0KVA9_PHAAN|nr:uncharacterized protein HKW66_Vig0248030 [Vigna angularis]
MMRAVAYEEDVCVSGSNVRVSGSRHTKVCVAIRKTGSHSWNSASVAIVEGAEACKRPSMGRRGCSNDIVRLMGMDGGGIRWRTTVVFWVKGNVEQCISALWLAGYCFPIKCTCRRNDIGEISSRRQRVGPRVNVDLNQNIEYIPEQPDWTRYRDPTPPSPPPSVDEYSLGQTQSVPSVPSGGISSSRGSKRKALMVDVIDSQFDKLTTSLDGFANVLSSSNVHFGLISDAVVRQVSAMEDRYQILRRSSTYTYTKGDIYEMLSGMNIVDENLLDQCYDFLCANPTCTKRLMGLPPHKRWNKLCKMISGGDC